MPTQTSATSEDGREPPASQAWSRRAQIVFVSVAMPVLVLLLVAAPYVLTHYVVNRHYRFNYIPLPLGGDRALEGHWTDAPAVPVRRVNFGADWSAFGWIAADDDLTTGILPTAPGTVSQIYTSVGQSVAKDAPLFAIRTEAGESEPGRCAVDGARDCRRRPRRRRRHSVRRHGRSSRQDRQTRSRDQSRVHRRSLIGRRIPPQKADKPAK